MRLPTAATSALAAVLALTSAACEKSAVDKSREAAEQQQKANERTAEAYQVAGERAGEAYDKAAQTAAHEQAKADEKAHEAEKKAFVEREDARTALAKDLGHVDERLATARGKVAAAKTTRQPKPVLEQRLKDLEAKSAELKAKVDAGLAAPMPDTTKLKERTDALRQEITAVEKSIDDLESQIS